MQGQYITATHEGPHSLVTPVCRGNSDSWCKHSQKEVTLTGTIMPWPHTSCRGRACRQDTGSAVTTRPLLLPHWWQNYWGNAVTAQKSCHKHTDPRKQSTAKELQDLLKLMSCRQKLGHASSAWRQSIRSLILAPTVNRFKISWLQRQFWTLSSPFTFAQEILTLLHSHIQEIVDQ